MMIMNVLCCFITVLITFNEPYLNKFVSIPKEYEGFNPSIIIAGMLESVYSAIGYACGVSAITCPKPNFPKRTIYLIKFKNT